jgi:hypothetical protein
MAKQKERSELEFLRGRVRELEALVKQLQKKASRSDKRKQQLENVVDEREEEAQQEVAKTFEVEVAELKCPSCGSKEFCQVLIGNRNLEMCDSCGHRKTVVVRETV